MKYIYVLMFCFVMIRQTLSVISVLSFGLSLYSFISTFHDDTNSDEVNESMFRNSIENILQSIGEANLYIENRIELSGHIGRLLNIIKHITSLLTDLKHIIDSDSEDIREANIKRYIGSYKPNRAHIKHIAYLLSEKIPFGGFSRPLIEVFADEMKCSLANVDEFERYYMNIVSVSFALSLTYDSFSDDHLSNQTKEEWGGYVERLLETFKKQRSICIDRFPELIKGNLDSTENATALQKTNTLRFSDKHCDVMFCRSTSCLVKYLKGDKLIRVKEGIGYLKIAVFRFKYDEAGYLDYNSSLTRDNCMEDFQTELNAGLENITTEECNVTYIETMFDDVRNSSGYIPRYWLIMDDDLVNEIALDEGSKTAVIKTCGKIIITAASGCTTGNATKNKYKKKEPVSAASFQQNNTMCMLISTAMAFLILVFGKVY